MPRSGIAGSYGSSIFSFLRNLHTVLHSGCILLQPKTYSKALPYESQLKHMSLSWTHKQLPCSTMYTATGLSPWGKVAGATVETSSSSWRPITCTEHSVFPSSAARDLHMHRLTCLPRKLAFQDICLPPCTCWVFGFERMSLD